MPRRSTEQGNDLVGKTPLRNEEWVGISCLRISKGEGYRQRLLCKGNFMSKGPLVDRSKTLRRPCRWSPENKGVLDMGWNGSGVRLWPGSVFVLRESEGPEEVKLMGRVGEAVCSDQKPHGPRVCHTEWSKSEIEKQIPYGNIYIWNLKKKKKKKKWFWRT